MDIPPSLTILSGIFFCLMLRGILSVHRHLRTVRSIQSLSELPVVLSPTDMLNPFWFLFGGFLTPILRSILPKRYALWLRVCNIGWTFKDGPLVAKEAWEREISQRARTATEREQLQQFRRKTCDSFVIVHPGGWRVVISDGPAVEEAMKKVRYWHRPDAFVSTLEIFGKNLVTTNGDDWARHRRITAPCFNDRMSALVWDESCHQALAMLSKWTASSNEPITTLHEDVSLIAFNVLAHVGFGAQQESFSRSQFNAVAPSSDHRMTYRDAMVAILGNQRLVASLHLLFPSWLRESPLFRWFPQKLRHADASTREFRQYMEEMLALTHEGNQGDAQERNTLISALVRSSNDQGSARDKLSDEEVTGNLYIFSVAGHATTANLMAFAITSLSIDQELQDWLREEIKRVLGGDCERGFHGKFHELFPKMVRMQAVENETLRVYRTALSIRVATQPTVINLSSGYILAVPEGTNVVLDTASIEKSPGWDASGHPSLSWSPKRWIQLDPESGEEKLVQPPGVTYLPFSTGPRICPGKRFALVESAAVLGEIFRKWRVKPALRDRHRLWFGTSISKEEEGRLAVQEVKNGLNKAGLTTDDITVTIPKRNRPAFYMERVK